MPADEALSVSRVIKATPSAVYRALLDPQAVAAWRAPDGMKAEVLAFEPRVGGTFRMSLAYTTPDHALPGKTTAHSDVARGRFRELVPDSRVVEEIVFESLDPAMAGTMVLTTTLTAVAQGTTVTVTCRDAPRGIGRKDHEVGIASTLENLARFLARS